MTIPFLFYIICKKIERYVNLCYKGIRIRGYIINHFIGIRSG